MNSSKVKSGSHGLGDRTALELAEIVRAMILGPKEAPAPLDSEPTDYIGAEKRLAVARASLARAKSMGDEEAKKKATGDVDYYETLSSELKKIEDLHNGSPKGHRNHPQRP